VLSDSPHAPVVFPAVSIGKEAEWATEAVWRLRQIETLSVKKHKNENMQNFNLPTAFN
jgi:ornithine cyclodeaminase/alanine dehydrogenase-like protein (mu-crystallin family)